MIKWPTMLFYRYSSKMVSAGRDYFKLMMSYKKLSPSMMAAMGTVTLMETKETTKYKKILVMKWMNSLKILLMRQT